MPSSAQDIRRRIGQLIMPRLEVDRFVREPEYANGIDALVRDSVAGGFCVFGGTAELVANTIRHLQSLAENSLLFSCDCEFGLPMRLTSGGTEFPDAMAIARTGEPHRAFEAGEAIGREMRALGIGWNFAPVADVNSNPANPIINTRAFGDDPETVIEYALQFMRGLHHAGIAATAKHFPGHGDTSLDSHRELPFIEKGWNEFNATELPPFEALIGAGVDSIMTGHLAAPALAKYLGASSEQQHLPATLSPILTTTLLRERLGFGGVIVTDALEMHAITKHFGAAEASLLAFLAGSDILLLPGDPRAAHAALLSALAEGTCSTARIEASLERIERMKQRIGIAPSEIDAGALQGVSEPHRALAETIAREAIELAGTIDLSGANLLILADDRPAVMEKVNSFAGSISERFGSAQVISTSEVSLDDLEFDGNTVLAIFHRARGYVSEHIAPRSVPALVREIAGWFQGQGITPRGLILFGSPYLDREFQTPPGFVLKTFSESMPSMRAVVQRMGSE